MKRASLGLRAGWRREETLAEKSRAGEEGVSSETGCSFSPRMLATRPKWASEARRVLNWETSSCEAAQRIHSQLHGIPYTTVYAVIRLLRSTWRHSPGGPTRDSGLHGGGCRMQEERAEIRELSGEQG